MGCKNLTSVTKQLETYEKSVLKRNHGYQQFISQVFLIRKLISNPTSLMMPERQLKPELFNPFVPNAPSLTPENRKLLRFSCVFRG